MNSRQKVIVSITGIFIVLLALVGLTYAYFLTRITGNENEKSISVTTANLELVYGDGNNLVTASNIEPGDPITPKTFTVTNNGNATVENFNIYLEDVKNSLSRKTDMIYTITCTNTTVGATSTTCDEFEVIENEVNGSELVFPSVVSIIARDTLEPATETTNAEQHTYTITLTYKEMNVDQSEDMNKRVEAKVNIYDGKTKFLATEMIKNAIYPYDSTSTVFLKDKIIGVNNKLLSIAEDNFGDSYYYNGNVNDNYLNYSGMCFRIMRIQGNGTIKIILADENNECNSPNYSITSEIGKMSGLMNAGQEYVFSSGPSFYGYNDLNNWLNNKILDKKDIELSEWCNDRTYFDYSEPEGGGTPTIKFGASGRIENHTTTFKCFDEYSINKNNYKNIGTLTADEVDLSTNNGTYLTINANKSDIKYATLSPANLYGDIGEYLSYVVLSSGGLSTLLTGGTAPELPASLRPVIVLKKDTKVFINSEINPGTFTNPYIVQ